MIELNALRTRLRDLSAKPGHESAVLRAWMRGAALDHGSRLAADFLPRALRAALPELEQHWAAIAAVRSEHPSNDSSRRLLIGLHDGQTVETVLLPRAAVCVSTQVGCAVGCVFCMTGRDGLIRQLGSAEIVAQVVQARRRQSVKKVVFMGMGEPSHNLENVLDTIDALGTLGGIGHKNLVFSTVGDRRVFERLPLMQVKPALAVSLHTMRAGLRAQLLPRAPRIDPRELVALANAYARATGYPIQYQWTLLDGVNDGDDELEALADALAGQYAVMNFIPYNRNEGLDGMQFNGRAFARPSWERAAEMTRFLYHRGVLAKLRHSAGQDVEGGCGQLRARGPSASLQAIEPVNQMLQFSLT